MENLSRKIGRNEEEDRLSTLPDELIHHIFSFLDSDLAAQTCVLSKRWLNLWSTLPFLKFDPSNFDRNGVYYRKFVTGFLFNRNHESDTCSIKIDFRAFDRNGIKEIVNYAISHRVEKFHICGAKLNWKLCFPILKHLTLLHCRVSLMKWDLPCLTTLYLDNVTILGDKLSFEGFKNLKDLTLKRCGELHSDREVFMIYSSTITSLSISDKFNNRPLRKYMIWAPNLSSFRFSGQYVPELSAVDGFPGIREVQLDIDIGKYEWNEYESDEKKQLLQKLINMLRQYCETKFLTLSLTMVQVLSRVPDFSEYQPSPFGNLTVLNVMGTISQRYEKPPNSSVPVVSYLLGGSPGANIFKKGFWGKFRKCNKEEDMLLRGGYENFFEVTSRSIALNKQATANTQLAPCTEIIYTRGLNMLWNSTSAFFRVSKTGLATCTNYFTDFLGKFRKCNPEEDMLLRAGHELKSEIIDLNKQARTNVQVNDSVSLWEGHEVLAQYVPLLTQIKQKHPETFEQFAPRTEAMYTAGLNMLCSSISTFSTVSKTGFTTSTITHFRDLFADLEKWGFNTSWLVTRLNNGNVDTKEVATH